jgi:hypothetical protein
VASIRQIVETVYDKLFNTFSASSGSDLMNWVACGLGWQRGWRCTTSVCGSISNWAAPAWPLPTCWDGDLDSHQAFKKVGRGRSPGAGVIHPRPHRGCSRNRGVAGARSIVLGRPNEGRAAGGLWNRRESTARVESLLGTLRTIRRRA